MTGRAMLLGAGAAAGPPPSGDTYGDTGVNTGGSPVRLTSWTPIPFDGHSGAFSWLEAGDATTYWSAAANSAGFDADGSSGSGQVTYCDQALPLDHYVSVIAASAGSRQVGPAIRIDPVTFTCYWFAVNGGDIEVWKGTGGSRVALHTRSNAYLDGDELELKAVGTTITFTIAGNVEWTGTDTDYSGLYAGFCAFRGRAAAYTNWHAGPAT